MGVSGVSQSHLSSSVEVNVAYLRSGLRASRPRPVPLRTPPPPPPAFPCLASQTTGRIPQPVHDARSKPSHAAGAARTHASVQLCTRSHHLPRLSLCESSMLGTGCLREALSNRKSCAALGALKQSPPRASLSLL
eukprot:scaffold18678_cov128-Isochrysis_galbana.AAC.2